MPIEVTVPPRDYSVTAPDRHTEYATVYGTLILTDQNGNHLTDQNGNELVITTTTIQNVYVVYAPPRDYSVTVPEVT